MFPHIRVSVDNLEPESMYVLSIEIVPSDNSRYTFSNGSWLPTGKAEPIKPGLYIHPDSPATGSEWMKKIVTFKKLKLTNTLSDNNDYVSNLIFKLNLQTDVVLEERPTQ